MGTRNYDLGTRDMKAAGRVALEEGMRSFSSIDTMADRWNLFIDYVREHHAIGRMELITHDIVVAYGETLVDRVDEGELEAATAQNYVSAVNRVLEIARGDRHIAVSPTRDCGIPLRTGIAVDNQIVSTNEHFTWLSNSDKLTKILLRLQRAFGLRFEESAKFDARNAETWLDIKVLPVTNGTKGGRQRKIPICTNSQRDILWAARQHQESHHSLIPQDMTYAEFRRQCYRIATAQGIRFHRERHTYANLRYKWKMGAESPVMIGIPHGDPHHEWLALQLCIHVAEAKERDQVARRESAEELGHGRVEVTNAYLG
jgi:hypothetical protein